MLSVREAQVQYLVENGWSPGSAELMAWAVHPVDRSTPPCTKALQKDLKRRADAVGQRSQGLSEVEAVDLAVRALVSYQHAAVQAGNEPLARVWADVVAEHAGTGAPAPTAAVAPDGTAADPDLVVTVEQAVPTPAAAPDPTASPTPSSGERAEGGWRHPVTLPPGRLGQLGSVDGVLEPVGRFATEVLAAHLVALPSSDEPDPDLDRRVERAALAGYLVDLDLAGVTPEQLGEPDGADLRLSVVRAAVARLAATDLDALAAHHSPAAAAVVERLAGARSEPGDREQIARGVGAGLALGELRRGAS